MGRKRWSYAQCIMGWTEGSTPPSVNIQNPTKGVLVKQVCRKDGCRLVLRSTGEGGGMGQAQPSVHLWLCSVEPEPQQHLGFYFNKRELGGLKARPRVRVDTLTSCDTGKGKRKILKCAGVCQRQVPHSRFSESDLPPLHICLCEFSAADMHVREVRFCT